MYQGLKVNEPMGFFTTLSLFSFTEYNKSAWNILNLESRVTRIKSLTGKPNKNDSFGMF